MRTTSAFPVRGYRGLIAWQKAMDLAELLLDISDRIRPSQRTGLVSQLRRAAISIPCNIAEGHGRPTRGEYAYSVGVSQGSLQEAETLLELALRRKALTESSVIPALEASDECARIIRGSRQSLIRPR